MPAGEYDISTEQGTTFTLSLTYKDSSDSAIDLESYTGRMQVRRSVNDNQVLLNLSGATASASLTGGGSTGEFSSTGATSGVTGTGGIQLNTSSTGGTGTTGGVYINIDAVSMANVPSGIHVYDIELVAGTTVDRILKGRFEVSAEITK
tara:strand:+ start:65 stop:511 length:447 start_codon:yes stop_codon:yes gene_type:complete